MSEVSNPEINELRAGVPIVDENGNPTVDFLRRWAELMQGLGTTVRQVEQTETDQATQQNTIIREIKNKRIYIGPSEFSPQNVTEPVLLILRHLNAPAGETSIVVREQEAAP